LILWILLWILLSILLSILLVIVIIFDTGELLIVVLPKNNTSRDQFDPANTRETAKHCLPSPEP
jgi:hypothetical protein